MTFAELMERRLAIYPASRYSQYAIGTISVGGWLSWTQRGVWALDWIQTAEQDDWKWARARQSFGRAALTVDRIRGTDDPAERRTLKEILACVTWGSGRIAGDTGVALPRDRRNVRGANPLIVFDLDHVDDPEAERDRLVREVPFAFAAGLSASGTGVWLACAVDREILDAADYARTWWTMAAILHTQHGVAIGEEGGVDRAPSNAVSLRFYSRDRDLQTDPNVVPYPMAGMELPDVSASRRVAGVAAEGRRTVSLRGSAIPPTPAYAERIDWVRAATRAGDDAPHNRALRAIMRDVSEGQTPDDQRIDAYNDAVGHDDRAEILRMVDGATQRVTDPDVHRDWPGLPDPRSDDRAVSERALAENIDARLPRHSLVHVPETDRWNLWTGDHWRDGTGIAPGWGAAVGEHTFGSWRTGGEGQPVWSPDPRTGGRRATAVNVLRFLGETDGRYRALEGWDRERSLLGLPGGECLEIGEGGVERRPQRADDFITQALPFAPADEWRGSPFETFLNRVVPDAETREYLQRVLGYGLICDGSEHAFLWLRGAPRSGKSTLMSFVRACMPRHFEVVAHDLLLLRRAGHHPAREAKLAKARIAYWPEARGEGHLDVERVKSWTGGDTQTSHFMRRDPFDWTPQFLLVVVGNDDLALPYPDAALYERTRLVDCWTTIPAQERSLGIWRAARAGDPACLAWLAEGAAAWKLQVYATDGSGLPPETVKMRADREQWQARADSVSAFVLGRYEVERGRAVVPVRRLHGEYLDWLRQTHPRSQPLHLHAFDARVEAIPRVAKVWGDIGHGKRGKGWTLVPRREGVLLRPSTFAAEV